MNKKIGTNSSNHSLDAINYTLGPAMTSGKGEGVLVRDLINQALKSKELKLRKLRNSGL